MNSINKFVQLVYAKDRFVICPSCEKDAIFIARDVYSMIDVARNDYELTAMARNNYQAVRPTKIIDGKPLLSGCCGEELISGPSYNRRWIAMRTRDAEK